MNGILLVDKPEGWTSSDVVCKLKGVFHQKKIGHSGMLDPMATGLLPVFFGKATKAIEFAENHRKVYLASLKLGIVTDTQDIWGRVLSENPSDVSTGDFMSVCRSFIGEIDQIPPMYSAVKIGGKKLYELARKGKEVERPVRRITIESLEVEYTDGTEYRIRIECSKGTYIRTLCHDIGERLGTGACMTALRRIACGPFDISDAIPLNDILAEPESVSSRLIPTDELFSAFPRYTASETDIRRIKCGVPFSAEVEDGIYRVYSSQNDFLMLGSAENNVMHSRKNFFEV